MYDNTALTLNIRALRRILQQGDDITQEITNTVKEINADRDHSNEWKGKKLDKARQVRNSELRKLGNAAMGLIEQIDAQITAQRDSFDHRDPDFTSALQMVQVYGKNMPYEVRQSVIDSLRGNYKALRSIKAAFESVGLPTDSINDAMGPLDNMGFSEAGTISEFASYAISDLANENQWRSGNIRAMLGKYESALGVDSSKNPVLAKLDKYIADPNTDPEMKHRAEVWRGSFAERLEADEERAMSMTNNRITAWQNGQAVPPQGVE